MSHRDPAECACLTDRRQIRFSHRKWKLLKCLIILVVVPCVGAKLLLAQVDHEHEVQILTPEKVGHFQPRYRPAFDDVAKLIVTQTNGFRKSHRLSELQRSPPLDQTAREFADYMARTDRYGHTADGQQPSERAQAQEYEICLFAENIAFQFSSEGFQTKPLAGRFVSAWKKSPGHRRNMLLPHITETGVAVAQSETTGVVYAVQLFGRPKSEEIKFQVTNRGDVVARYRLGEQEFDIPAHAIRSHQLCTPEALELLSSSDVVEVVHPENGSQFSITIEDGQPKLTPETTSAAP